VSGPLGAWRGAPLDQKGAERFDREVVPRWHEVFARLLVNPIDIGPKSTILDVGCGTGTLTLALLTKADESSRIIAIDRGGAAMDIARQRVGALAGRRVFFKTERDQRLAFAPEVFDLVLANLVVADLPDPTQTLREMRRVLKRGGRVGVTCPLRGSYIEVLDLLREVLLKFDVEGAMRRLDEYVEHLLDERRAVALLEDAGFADVTLERESFSLSFRNSKDFLSDAMVELVLMPDLRHIAGEAAADRVLFHLREAIDTYFSPGTFTLAVTGGAVFGTRPAVGVDLVSRETHAVDFEMLDGPPADDEPTV
jgi:ubiquinone/menaquinone biosynthesis C-methylase UbiE